MPSIVNNVFIEADPRPQLFLQQIDFVEEPGCTAKGVGQSWAIEREVSRTG